MTCAYCGNSWNTDVSRCDGCGSGSRMRQAPAYRDADELYAEVGHALITGEPSRSRELLDRIIGSPAKQDPQRLWTERSVKIGICLVLFWMFPWVFLAGAFMIMPFIVTIYLPYKGLNALFAWINGDSPVRR